MSRRRRPLALAAPAMVLAAMMCAAPRAHAAERAAPEGEAGHATASGAALAPAPAVATPLAAPTVPGPLQQRTGPLRYVRVYADDDELSHFDDGELPFATTDDAPPAPVLDVTALQAGSGVQFLRFPSGWHGDWRAAPRRQFVVGVAGVVEVRVGDAEVRRFGPGSVLLVEDTVGQGHTTRVIGDAPLVLAVLPLSPNQ